LVILCVWPFDNFRLDCSFFLEIREEVEFLGVSGLEKCFLGVRVLV